MRKTLFFLICFFSIHSLSAQTEKKIIILHTNDLHSRLIGYSPESAYSPLSINDDKTVGGFARIAAIMKEEREKNNGTTLILDAGDFMMGTLFPSIEKETGFQLRLMKTMGYDAICLGNHEYDFGSEWLAAVINTSRLKGEIPSLLASNVVFDKKVTIFEKVPWKFRGKWETYTRKSMKGNEVVKLSQCAQKKNDMVEFTFTGTGVSLTGTWNKEGGKADIFVDGKFDRTIDTYFNFNKQQYGNTSIWHKFNLTPGIHKIRVEVKGEKRAESEGTKINLTEALIFITAPKKNENFKFSFE